MALGDIIARLSVELALNSASFEKGAARSGKQVDQLGDRFEKMGNRVGTTIKAFATAGAAIAGSAIFQSLRDSAKEGLEYASSLGEVSTQLGVTASELQQYRFIATQVGIDQEVMDKGLSKLSITLGDVANGAKAPTEALERLGFSQEEITRISGLTAGQAIPVLADAFSKLKSPTEQASIAADLFGSKMGGKFLTLLNEGSEGINKLTDAYRKMGIELTEGEVKKADAALDAQAIRQEQYRAKLAKFAIANGENILKAGATWDEFKLRALAGLGGTIKAFDKFEADVARVMSGFRNRIRSGLDGLDAFAGSVERAMRTARDAVVNMVGQIASAIGGRLNAVWEAAKAKVEQVKQTFFNLWTAVTRRSYVPDMVDDIAFQMLRLDTVLVAQAEKATGATEQAFRDLASKVRPLLDQLFPDAARLREFRDTIEILDQASSAGLVTPMQGMNARMVATGRFLAERNKDSDRYFFGDAFDDVVKAANDNAKKIEAVNVRVVKSFKDMADGTLGALQNLASSIKGGGFLDILGAVIGLGTQLASIGAFGKKIAANVNRVEGRAGGGLVSAGRPYLVGERGPELVVPSNGGNVIPNSRLGGGAVVHNHFSGNLLTPEFWAQINHGDAQAAQTGSVMAHSRDVRRRKWALA